MEIRLSLGSAIYLGLQHAQMDTAPTTLYIMLGEGCVGGCAFCAQARTSTTERKYLSRVIWPAFELDAVLERMRAVDRIERVCIQTTLYAGLHADLLTLVTSLRAHTQAAISICMNPAPRTVLEALKAAGVSRVGVGLDCATRGTFERIKPGFDWDSYQAFVDTIAEVFGSASVHLIVGLGDTDEAIVQAIQAFLRRRATVALFAYTPVRGTRLDLKPPDIGRYRALQLARYLITTGKATAADMAFEDGRLVAFDVEPEVMAAAITEGVPFETSGCSKCNRPNYNERPGGALYNYPRPLEAEEVTRAMDELRTYLEGSSITR